MIAVVTVGGALIATSAAGLPDALGRLR